MNPRNVYFNGNNGEIIIMDQLDKKIIEAYDKIVNEELKMEYLTEGKLENTDKNMIMKFISSPPKKEDSYILKSYSKNWTEEERDISIIPWKTPKTLGVGFEYNGDFDELTNFFNDLKKDKKYTVKINHERNINTTNVTVYKEV
jgi:hypothetical protein